MMCAAYCGVFCDVHCLIGCFMMCAAHWGVLLCALHNELFCDVRCIMGHFVMCTAQWGVSRSALLHTVCQSCSSQWAVSLASAETFQFFLCFQVAKSRNNHILQIHKLVMFTAGHKFPVGSKEATNTGCVKKSICMSCYFILWVLSFENH